MNNQNLYRNSIIFYHLTSRRPSPNRLGLTVSRFLYMPVHRYNVTVNQSWRQLVIQVQPVRFEE
jgi:hypothetical protein